MPSTSSAGDVAQFYLPLPPELIREIIINVSQRMGTSTLITLALVSKTFHNLVVPILYHSVRLEADKDTLTFIRCIKAAHASSMNAKHVASLFFEPDTMIYFDDVMSLPGLNPQTIFFEASSGWGVDIDYQAVSSWEACPKGMGVIKYSQLSHRIPWVSQRMALFSQLTHLYLEVELDGDDGDDGDEALSFCLELQTLTHICFPMRRGLNSTDALRQIHLLLGMPLMEVVLIYPVLSDDDDDDDHDHPEDPEKDKLNSMGFPKVDLFPLLADLIPDERLYMCPEPDMFEWFMGGITPWNFGMRHLTMPWRRAVTVA